MSREALAKRRSLPSGRLSHGVSYRHWSAEEQGPPSPGTGCTEEGAAELELREGPSLPKGDKGVLASGEPDF